MQWRFNRYLLLCSSTTFLFRVPNPSSRWLNTSLKWRTTSFLLKLWFKWWNCHLWSSIKATHPFVAKRTQWDIEQIVEIKCKVKNCIKHSYSSWFKHQAVTIVLLTPDLELPTGNDVSKLTSRISKKNYPSVSDGVVKISSEGFACQWIYFLPFKKVMTKDHLHALKKASSYPRTNQTNAECCEGYYKNFGLRSTCQASGSLLMPSNQTSKHHHYCEGLTSLQSQFLQTFAIVYVMRQKKPQRI